MLASNGRHIGRIAKLHGVKGEVILASDALLAEKTLKTEWVFLIIDGLPVPFRLLEFQLRNDTSAILALEGYHTPEESEYLLGYEVLVEQKRRKQNNIAPPKPQDIKGYSVVDINKGMVGIASQVVKYDKNMVLEVMKDTKEILIPIDESIILSIDDKKKVIHVQLPEGLLDLYL